MGYLHQETQQQAASRLTQQIVRTLMPSKVKYETGSDKLKRHKPKTIVFREFESEIHHFVYGAIYEQKNQV